jgi:hypothetical protein
MIATPGGGLVPLRDVADVDISPHAARSIVKPVRGAWT